MILIFMALIDDVNNDLRLYKLKFRHFIDIANMTDSGIY